MSLTDDLKITAREFLAGLIAAVSFCGSLAFGYGVKSQQVEALQSVVAKHDAAIATLSDELVKLRLVVAELNGNLSKGK